MRRLVFGLSLALLCLVSLASAQPAPAESTPASAAPAASQPSVLSQFDQSYDTLMIVPDLLPHIEKVLSSAKLQQLWAQGKLISVIRRQNPAITVPDLQAAWFIVLQASRWVPDEIAVGFTQQSWDQIDHWLRGVTLFNLAAAAQSAPELSGERMMLQPELAKEMSQLTMPQMRLWVRFRAETDADVIFGLVAEQVKMMLGGERSVKVVSDETSLKISFAVADAVPEMPQRYEALKSMGMIRDRTDGGAKALAEALGKLKFSGELVRYGSGLRLTLGEPAEGSPKPGPLAAADLGPLFSLDGRTILYSTWDGRALMSAAAGWVKMAREYRDSPLAKRAPAGGLAATIALLGEQILQSSPRGASHIATTDNGIAFQVAEHGLPEPRALDQTAVIKLIPAGTEAFAVNSIASVASLISNSVTQIELRLEQGAGTETVPQAHARPQPMQQMMRAYRKQFMPLRDFLVRDSIEWFKPGLAVIGATQGTVKRFDIEPRGEAPFNGRNLPVPEVAVVGEPATAEQGQKYPHEVYRKLTDGVIALINEHRAADKQIKPPADGAVKQAELGLGVPTWTFDVAWLHELAGDDVTFAVEGDLQPHYFLHEGALVLSTSPRLSRQMLEAARGGKSIALPAPPAGKKGALVAFGDFHGKLGATIFDHAALWAKSAVEQLEPAPERAAQQKAQSVPEILRGVGEYFGLIEKAPWQSWQQGDTRTTSGEISFVK